MDDDVAGDRESDPGDRRIEILVPEEARGARLDKALADAVDPATGLSRSHLRRLIENGRLHHAGATLRDASLKVKAAGLYVLTPPAPAPAEPQAEAIPLEILFEDDALIVVNKPAGMAAHPAPGSETGTLVNALLAHCGASLSGVGGVARPGIVHRIDKETSGLLVVAKTDAAHQGLSAQFAAHDLDRRYLAIAWGAPSRSDPRLAGLPAVTFEDGIIRIDAPIARHPTDRKRMAVARNGQGKRAVTRVETLERFEKASLVSSRLETGRTHQIRVHLAHIGHPLLGDPVYGRDQATRAKTLDESAAAALAGLHRQALHAATLGFTHPISGDAVQFESAPPADFRALLDALRAPS